MLLVSGLSPEVLSKASAWSEVAQLMAGLGFCLAQARALSIFLWVARGVHQLCVCHLSGLHSGLRCGGPG